MMTKNILSLNSILVVILLCFKFDKAASYKTGTGSCVGGKNAVCGSHVESGKEIVSMTLAEAGVTVKAGKTTLKTGSTNKLSTGTLYDLSVTVKDDMHGVFIRVQAPKGTSTKGVLKAGTNTKVTDVCVAPVVGVSHYNGSDKSSASGKLRFNAAVKGVFVDITVVFENEEDEAEHAYGRFKIDFSAPARLRL
jgi:hypothetical protein